MENHLKRNKIFPNKNLKLPQNLLTIILNSDIKNAYSFQNLNTFNSTLHICVRNYNNVSTFFIIQLLISR